MLEETDDQRLAMDAAGGDRAAFARLLDRHYDRVHALAWRFTGVSVKRAIKATKLQRDLDLNLPGVALALDLIDEIERLRERLRHLE